MADAPTFPVLLQCIPPPRRQRCLIPIEELPEIDDPCDPAGWAANESYRIIDSNRHVFTATHDGSVYHFCDSGERVTDTDLRELMCENIRNVGCAPKQFFDSARSLEGNELFEFSFRFAQELPEMTTGLRVVGCTLILVLCSAAFVLPFLLVKFFWR